MVECPGQAGPSEFQGHLGDAFLASLSKRSARPRGPQAGQQDRDTPHNDACIGSSFRLRSIWKCHSTQDHVS